MSACSTRYMSMLRSRIAALNGLGAKMMALSIRVAIALAALFTPRVKCTVLMNYNLVRIDAVTWTTGYTRAQDDRGPV